MRAPGPSKKKLKKNAHRTKILSKVIEEKLSAIVTDDVVENKDEEKSMDVEEK